MTKAKVEGKSTKRKETIMKIYRNMENKEISKHESGDS